MLSVLDGMRFGFGILLDVIILLFIFWVINEITSRIE